MLSKLGLDIFRSRYLSWLFLNLFQDSTKEVVDASIRDDPLLPRETRNSIFFRNKNVLVGSVIQYNAEKLIEDELNQKYDKVSNLNLKFHNDWLNKSTNVPLSIQQTKTEPLFQFFVGRLWRRFWNYCQWKFCWFSQIAKISMPRIWWKWR